MTSLDHQTRVPTKRPRVDTAVGGRIRAARRQAGLTQRQVAGDRYTGAYISALEIGLVRPSWAALTYLSGRLGLAVHDLVRDTQPAWARLTADLHLAAGNFQLAADCFSQLLETATGTDAALIRGGRAEALSRLGRPRDALPDAAAAYEALTKAGRPVDAAYAGYWLADAHQQLDNTEEARALLRQILAEVRADLVVQADFKLRLLVALANLEASDGRDDRALALLEEGRALTGEMDVLRRATFLFSLAGSYSEAGDHDAALRAGNAALLLFEAANAEREATWLRNTLALTYLRLGDTTLAIQLAAEARQMSTRSGDQELLADVTETEAQLALASGDHVAVRERIAEAIDLARRTQNTNAESRALLTLARSQRQNGEGDAEATYRQAAELLRKFGPPSRLAEVLREWADLLVIQERHAEAVGLLQEALTP